MSDSNPPDDPPESAGRILSNEAHDFSPPHFRGPLKGVHDSVARFRLLWALLIGFFTIFGVDVAASWRFWKELHDVADTLAPFITLFAGAIGSAITFYYTDRNRQ